MTKSSDTVFRWSANLIYQLNLDAIEQELQSLLNTVCEKKGKYQSFLDRWGYDQEQKQAMQQEITQLISWANVIRVPCLCPC